MTPLYTNGSAPPALAHTLHSLQRRFGPAGMVQPARSALPPTAAIPTGFPALDAALGIGGLPRGRVVDIFGPESSGKSTLCLHVIAQAQRLGGTALFVDTEHALDPDWLRQCGVDAAALYVAQPDNAETALEIVAGMAAAGMTVIVLDSAAALAPRAELETDMGDIHPGLMAGLLSQALRKLVGPLYRSRSLLIVTNQLRRTTAGGETRTGGSALRHYASVRLELRPQRALRERGRVVGRRIRATVVKNRLAPPHRSATFEIWHGGGQ